jgi:hypothetical protein
VTDSIAWFQPVLLIFFFWIEFWFVTVVPKKIWNVPSFRKDSLLIFILWICPGF